MISVGGIGNIGDAEGKFDIWDELGGGDCSNGAVESVEDGESASGAEA